MQDSQTIRILISKIQNGLPDIKTRSISSLYTKISVGIVSVEALPRLSTLPGVLLQWINSNSNRSEALFKVLTILSYFSKTKQGLVLLQQYEASQFFKQLKEFLLEKHPKHDQYITILDNMIKELFPLATPTNIKGQTAQPTKIASSLIQIPKKQQIKANDIFQFSWTVSRYALGKKEQDQLYGLLMELKHGKRELHLQWLKRILELVSYWGSKWFRFRQELINELTALFSSSKLKWLIVDIFCAIIKGLSQNAILLQRGWLQLINLNSNKISTRPEVQKITICFKAQIFQSIYSSFLIEELIKSNEKVNISHIDQFLFRIDYHYSPKYFYSSLQNKLKKGEILDEAFINNRVMFYCQNFKEFQDRLASLIISSNGYNAIGNISTLSNYLEDIDKKKCQIFLAKYGQKWQLGENLHHIEEVMCNLEKGIDGVAIGQMVIHVDVYLNCLLTLGVSIERQDPLMAYYPKVKQFIIKIAQNCDARMTLFQQCLKLVSSEGLIKYGKKSYSIKELSWMVFSDEKLFSKLFAEALNSPQGLIYWLQLIQKTSHTNIDDYSLIFYYLTYHANQQIKAISKSLSERLSKEGKCKVQAAKLFSRSSDERLMISRKLFNDRAEALLLQLEAPFKQSSLEKKPLKMSGQSVQNYMNIIFNAELQEEIRLNAAKQLLECLERAEISNVLLELYSELADNIILSLRSDHLALPFVSVFIHINGLLNRILPQKHTLSINQTVELLRLALPAKTIQILLRNLYVQCFQNPFTEDYCAHYTSFLYPHIQYVEIPAATKAEVKKPLLKLEVHQKQSKISIPTNYKQILDLQNFMEWAIFTIINDKSVALDQVFVGIVEKQIGEILHNKGYAKLHYLAYSFNFLKDKGVPIPKRLMDCSTLLNTLLTRDLSAFNAEPIAILLSIIGWKKTRQLQTILANGPAGLWKYHILFKLPVIQSHLLQSIIKGLLAISFGKEAVLILRLVLLYHSNIQLSLFSQTLLLSSSIKFIRQDSDMLLRKTSLCLLTQLFGTVNLQCEGVSDVFCSIISFLVEESMSLNLAVLAMNLLKKIVQCQVRVLSNDNIVKIFLDKAISILSLYSPNPLLPTAFLQLLTTIVLSKGGQYLQKYEIVDLALSYLVSLQEKQFLTSEEGMLASSVIRFIYIWAHIDRDLPKYLLSSTKILTYLIAILQLIVQGDNKLLLQNIARFWLMLSHAEEQIFVHKLNQTMSTSSKHLFAIFNSRLDKGGLNYLKMMSYTLVIWSRNREQIQSTSLDLLSIAILKSQQPYLIKWLLPFSLQAKILLLNSPLLQQLLKTCLLIIDNRMVQETKDKKKKAKCLPNKLQEQQRDNIEKCFSLLSYLYYWSGQSGDELEGGQNLRKVMLMLQKFYSCREWEDDLVKLYVKVVTNMSICRPFAVSCATRFSESVIMIEDIVARVSKSQSSEGQNKLALKLLGVLVHLQSVRNMVLRAHVVEQLCSKLNRAQERADINVEYAMDIVQLLLALSVYKDANTRLLSDKKVLDVLLRVLKLGKFSLLEEKIVALLGNLACFKSNKAVFMSNRDVHKVILGLLEDQDNCYHSGLLILLYNILYKNAAAVRLYRRPQVLQIATRCFNVSAGGIVELGVNLMGIFLLDSYDPIITNCIRLIPTINGFEY